MERESFEDSETAALMNQSFVNIKVDREERPDLDAIYMDAVVALTGHGGWPMTVFLTPDGEPFYGGTYFPPVPRYGMPSFRQLLTALAQSWKMRRGEVQQNAGQLTDHIRRDMLLTGSAHPPDPHVAAGAVQQLARDFDAQEGGFGGAPKFPPSMVLDFLLRQSADSPPSPSPSSDPLHLATFTLRKMACGGIYDQLGGGFARYATDVRWLVPHFEKMLYDNALLARAFLHAWQRTGDPFFRRITEETLDWVLREMTHPDGGFYSSLDADSEGEEGRFYVWQSAEIERLLGPDAPLVSRWYQVSPAGNWEGHNILHTPRPPADVAAEFGLTESEAAARIAAARPVLLAARSRRVWPGLDDKVLTAWNGLMLAALAEAGALLQRDDYLTAARRNAHFLLATLRRPDGRLLRTWRDGAPARYNGYLEDYAFLADGLLALYQATHEPRWFGEARSLAQIILDHFPDRENGGFFETADDHEALIFRPKSIQDNAIPSGNAMAARVLLTLALLTGNGEWRTIAAEMAAAIAPAAARFPTGFGHWLGVMGLLSADPVEIAISGDPADPATQALIAVVREAYRPHIVLAVGMGDEVPLLAGRGLVDGRPAAWVCRNFTCELPVTTPDGLRAALQGKS
jgi:uncharacterized protein YyaL (SSP411 family)